MYRYAPNFLIILLLSTANSSYAERADRDKPMHLDADKVVIDEAQKISTFTGNVQFTQGTRVLRGDKIVVTQDKEGFQRGVVYGSPASFKQKRDGVDEYVEGYGERIEYDAKREVIDFYTQARIKRNADEIKGEHITYNAKSEIMQVNGGPPQGNTPPARVRMTIQPSKNKTAE